MSFENTHDIQTRLDALEAKQAVIAGFISVLLQSEIGHLAKEHRSILLAAYETLFEQTIAHLLASSMGFSDSSVRAIEDLKAAMLGTLQTSRTADGQ